MFINSKMLSVVGVVLVTMVVSQAHANMITNPEFNDGLTGYDYPATITTSCTDKFYVGPKSALITFPSDYGAKDTTISQYLPVTAGDIYKISAAIAFQNINSAHVKVIWYESRGWYLKEDYVSYGQSGDSDWMVKSASFTAPVQYNPGYGTFDAAFARVMVFSYGPAVDTAPGYLWVDSFSVVPEPAAIGLLGLGGLLLARRRRAHCAST